MSTAGRWTAVYLAPVAVIVFFQPLSDIQRNSRIYRIVFAPEHVKETTHGP